jgi:hypothetical protein
MRSPLVAAPGGSISLQLPGPGTGAFIGSGLAAIAAAYAAIHGGPAFVVGLGLVFVAAYLAWVGLWIEKHPAEIVRAEWQVGHPEWDLRTNGPKR